MLKGKRIIAVIPARGGSKRLPRKNILPLANKPLIGWTIEAAKQSQYIDEVFVSTDDQEIADIAVQFGIDVPELRPHHLSTDEATTQDVLFYTLERFGKNSDVVVLLQPTSPFRTHQHIDEALESFERKSAFSIVSVTLCEHPIQWSNILSESDSMENFLTSKALRSQDCNPSYRLNGAIYVYDVKKLFNEGSLEYRTDSYAYKMSNRASVDIDNKLDFEWAEFLVEKSLNTALDKKE